MLRMRWQRMVRVLHRSMIRAQALGRRGRILVIFVGCDNDGTVLARRRTRCVVVTMIVCWGIAEAGGA